MAIVFRVFAHLASRVLAQRAMGVGVFGSFLHPVKVVIQGSGSRWPSEPAGPPTDKNIADSGA